MDSYGIHIFTVVFFIVVPLVIFLLPFGWWQVAPSRLPGTRIGRLLGRHLDVSLRNLFLRAYFLIVYGGLFMVWGFPLLLMVLVWGAIFLLIYRFFVQTKGKRLPFTGIIVILAGIGLFTAGLLAPARSGIVSLFFLRGEAAGGLLNFLAAYEEGARIDRLIGPAGALSAVLWVFLDSFWRLRQARQVENLPTSTVRSAAVGLVELQGTARAVDPSEPVIAMVTWDLNTYTSPKQWLSPFYLEDETGRILVDPAGCRVRAGWITDIGSMFMVREVVLTRHVKREDTQDRVTRTLRHGDQVYVIGSAEPMKPGRGAARSSGELVVRPSARPKLDEALWRLFFGTWRLPAGRDIYNVFFISDTSERKARSIILRGFRVVGALGFLWLVLSLWLTWSAYHRLDNYKVIQVRTPIEGGVFIEHFYRHKTDIHREKNREEWEKRQARRATPAGKFDTLEKKQFGPAELASLLRDSNVSAVNEARAQLLALGPAAAAAVPELVMNLDDDRDYVRRYTLEVLRKIGAGARGAAFAVAEALDDSDRSVRYAAITALREIGPDISVLPRLLAALRDEDRLVRMYAVECVAKVGPEARHAVPLLTDILIAERRDYNFRGRVLSAYRSIGLDYPEAVPYLTAALDVDDPAISQYAAETLGGIGADARPALPALRKAAEREKRYGHRFAAKAIKAIGDAPSNAEGKVR
jgi:HEAT repeat protein